MINYKVRSTPANLAKVISDAPRLARGPMTEAAAVYLIGNMGRGLKHYQPYKYVSRKQAYGKTFQSDRQRRFVMAAIREGRIDPGYPHRTGRLQRGWYKRNSGAKTIVSNKEPHAPFVQGDGTQARLNQKAGWRTVSKVASDNDKGMIRAAEQELQRYLKKKGLA